MTTTFEPHAIDLADIRPGDGIHWERDGWFAWILAHLIHWLKEPSWDMRDWHLTPVVFVGKAPQIYYWCDALKIGRLQIPDYENTYIIIMDAQLPRVKLTVFDPLKPHRKCWCYRVVENPPSQEKLNKFVLTHNGRKYDLIGYVWNGLAKLLRPRIEIPRVIDNAEYCWEVLYDMYFLDDWDPAERTDYDYLYPDICDLRRAYGEMPLK
jgi:hypothetical protein